jgi:hypothetical protein
VNWEWVKDRRRRKRPLNQPDSAEGGPRSGSGADGDARDRQRRRFNDGAHQDSSEDGERATAQSRGQRDRDREHSASAEDAVKNLDVIQMGRHQITAWYYSPYPEQLTKDRTLYVCEFCLNYFRARSQLDRHAEKCPLQHPPGDEIYRNGDLSFFEIDGSANKTYCQNLCLLSKLFLDHKTLDNGVELFMFYVMTSRDEHGCHIVGYFSKEKDSPEGFNLACILTLPPFQRRGYGKLLIQFSYELSKKEGRVGSPEKPLSDLGLLSYRSYWAETIIDILLQGKDISVRDISDMTKIKVEDILGTLQAIGLIKTWNGTHILCVSPQLKAQHMAAKKKYPVTIDPELLHWVPIQKVK